MADTLKARMEALKVDDDCTAALVNNLTVDKCLALLDEHCRDGCTHHAALKRCVEALDAAKDKLHRECSGQREYTGGIPTQTLFPLIDQALAELKEIL